MLIFNLKNKDCTGYIKANPKDPVGGQRFSISPFVTMKLSTIKAKLVFIGDSFLKESSEVVK